VIDGQGHVLVVDDEASIAEPLADYLGRNGYKVSTASSADGARRVLEKETIDLVLLDIMMPGEDGLSLTRQLRVQSSIPIILLTARTEDMDRIIGLEMGADDYVAKPFNPRELLARIKAVLRRTNETPTVPQARKAYQFSGFRLDIEARTLHAEGGEEIPLTGGEFALLQTLLDRAGRVMNRDQLLELTQGREAHVFDRSIDNQISRLRKKIEADPKSPSIIKTIRGGGYVLSGPVRTA
jgi:two-component system OmpR family response regulator